MWSFGWNRRKVREHWWHRYPSADEPAGSYLQCEFCSLKTTMVSPPSTPCSRREHDHANHWLSEDGSIVAATSRATAYHETG
jgi:hypothetical protein